MSKDSVAFIANCIMAQMSVIDDAESNETFKVSHAVLYDGYVCPLSEHNNPVRLRHIYISYSGANKLSLLPGPQMHMALEDDDFPLFWWLPGKSLEEAVEDFNKDAKERHESTLQILC